jgi:hypothetical protein
MLLRNASIRRLAGGFLGLAILLALNAPSMAASTARADKAISQAGVLVLADFPSGWAASPQSSSNNNDQIVAGIPACRAVVKARNEVRKSRTKADSKDFKKSDETYSNTVGVLATPAAAAQAFAAYNSTQGQKCLQQIADKASQASLAKSSATIKNPKVSTTFSEVSGPTVGDASVRYRIELAVTASNLPIAQKAYLDEVIAQTGRALTAYQYQSQFERSDNHFLDQLIGASQRRLMAALAGQPPPDPSKPAPLGTAQAAADGSVVTIYSVAAGVPGKYPGVGGPFTIVDAQICAQKGASNVNANPHDIRLVFADNTSATETFGGPDPQLNFASLNDGACTRGNVAFMPTTGATLAQVVYDPGSTDSKPLSWSAS